MIVGRDAELARLSESVLSERPAWALLEGDAGVGKTTLWLSAVDEASATRRVLAARPAETEAVLPYAGLGDLLQTVPDEVLRQLPDGQRHAIELALQRATARQPATQLAVSRAVLGVVEALGARGPLLIAVDDVQWLDAPTQQALEFALRRLGASPVNLLLARRAAVGSLPPLGLGRPPPGVDVAYVTVGPLTLDDIGAVLRAHLGLALSRPRLAEVQRACGGNPLYALEMGRALLTMTDVAADDPLPVPAGLAALLRRRISALSSSARLAVVLTAASPQPAASTVERAAGESEGLAEAVDRGVIEVDGDRLRFAHPLLGSIAYASASERQRREAHARLSRNASSRIERAHHLSLSADAADAAIAAQLDEAAEEASRLGAADAAARLMERAGELSPSALGHDGRRRLAVAAGWHVISGDPRRGRAILERLVGSLEPGPERAQRLMELADLGDDPAASIRLCQQALAEASADPAVGAQVEAMLSTLNTLVGERQRATDHARASLALAERVGDGRLLAIGLADLCFRLVMQGLPYQQADIDRALDLERSFDDFPALRRPSVQYGVILGYTDRPDEARPLLQAELARLERAGNESWQIGLCFRLADIELRAGNWMEAASLARRALAAALHSGIEQERAIGLMIHGLVQAHLGNLAEARAAATDALDVLDHEGNRAYATRSRAVLGFIELSRGDAEAALAYLAPASADLRRGRAGELSVHQVMNNEIDALVALGRREQALATIEFVEEMGAPTNRSWHAAVAARGRALVASADGDPGEARRHLDRALAAHDRLPQPFELGRTLLAQGAIERRARNRRAARAALARALEIFDQLGAPLWAEKAAAELARIPGRMPATGRLSETERRVAQLVAAGRSNKEVAADLFVAVRTVEANLTRVYAKLGVRSRTELAAAVNRGGAADQQ